MAPHVRPGRGHVLRVKLMVVGRWLWKAERAGQPHGRFCRSTGRDEEDGLCDCRGCSTVSSQCFSWHHGDVLIRGPPFPVASLILRLSVQLCPLGQMKSSNRRTRSSCCQGNPLPRATEPAERGGTDWTAAPSRAECAVPGRCLRPGWGRSGERTKGRCGSQGRRKFFRRSKINSGRNFLSKGENKR